MPVNVDRKIIFDAVKRLRGGAAYSTADVAILDAAIDAAIREVPAVEPAAPPTSPRFALSQTSLGRLAPVRKQLADTVKRAIQLSLVDFRVQQGERTLAEQKAAVAAGNSRTMHSKHLRQSDGTVWAVDLVVLTNGAVNWSFPLYAGIAHAMDQAA